MGISPWQIAILLVVVILIFGTSKLKNMGKDLGGAVKGFKKAMNDEENKPEETKSEEVENKTLEQKQEDASFVETKDKDESK